MRKSPNYWTKERCIKVALLCNIRNEFCNSYKGVYKRARINGWLDELCTHMKSLGNLRRRLMNFIQNNKMWQWFK